MQPVNPPVSKAEMSSSRHVPVKSSSDSDVLPHVYDLLARDRRRNGVAWWPLGARYLADPYPDLRRLRETAPCHHCSLTGGVLVTRYKDVDRVLRDFTGFPSGPFPDSGQPRKMLVGFNPPEHTRMRRLAMRAFTHVQMAQMEDYTRATAHKLLDRVADRDVFDWMSALAKPLPVLVIGRMVGLQEDEMDIYKSWVERRRFQLDAYSARWIRQPSPSKEYQRWWLRTHVLFTRCVARLVEERRTDPQDDMVSRLVEADGQGDLLTHGEAQAVLYLMFSAGDGLTTKLMGTGLLALLRHPERARLLRERPELLADAVEELLRYDAPLQTLQRIAFEDTEIAGTPVAAGSLVTVLIGAANRDPERFEQPDKLDFARADKHHVTFGRGIHHCPFPRLVRLTARVAFEVLLERFSDVQLAASRPPAFARGVILRGTEHLHVRVRRPARVCPTRRLG